MNEPSRNSIFVFAGMAVGAVVLAVSTAFVPGPAQPPAVDEQLRRDVASLRREVADLHRALDSAMPAPAQVFVVPNQCGPTRLAADEEDEFPQKPLAELK